jgi:hypothetical protein
VQINAACLLGEIPSPAERIKQDVVKKLDRKSVWQHRCLILSKSGVFVVCEKGKIVKDHVPLDEIDKVTCIPPALDEGGNEPETQSARLSGPSTDLVDIEINGKTAQWLAVCAAGLHALSIKTRPDGMLGGRVIQFYLETKEDTNEWVAAVEKEANDYKSNLYRKSHTFLQRTGITQTSRRFLSRLLLG